MNPFPVVLSMFSRQRFTLILFAGLIAFAVALGVAISAQERALRQGSARASDKFDILVGAPGSQYDLVLAGVYLRLTSMELLPPDIFAQILEHDQVEWAAPLAFGDSAAGYPIVGTTAQFVEHLSEGLSEGHIFETVGQAVIGADVEKSLGETFLSAHGEPGMEDHFHQTRIEVVGRMARTHTPWDRAIAVPVELTWDAHGLESGHAPADENDEHEHEEEHHDGAHDHDHAEPEPDHLGPPFDLEHLPGVPALVVKPVNLAAAYGLRNEFRTARSQALFPAEILVQLYALMGDARAVLNLIVLATQFLVVAAILAGLTIILRLYRSRFATLRVLGATPVYIFIVCWVFFTILVLAGAALGLALGMGAAYAVSGWLSQTTGFAVAATITWSEISLVLGLIAASGVMALIPAFTLYRRPVIEDLAA